MTSPLEKFVERYGRLPTEIDPDYLEMLRMGRFRMLEVPDVSPGKCCNCGSSKNDERTYIDVGLQIEWYGAVFFCTYCIKELATYAGMFGPLEEQLEVATGVNKDYTELQEQGAELHSKLVKTFKELEDYYARLYPPRNYTDSDRDPDLVVDPPANEPNVNPPESRTTKSSNGSRRKDVPSLADLINQSTK